MLPLHDPLQAHAVLAIPTAWSPTWLAELCDVARGGADHGVP